MRFTLKQIAYFVATAETGSITLASERVNISQPSISSAITALEEAYGIQLFIRHHAQGLSLTAEGQRFLREARALLLQAEEVENAALEISARVAGPLEVGCLSTLFPLVVPELLSQFRHRFEAARAAALAGSQIELFEHLRSGRISLLLTYDLAIPPDFEFLPLAPVQPYAYVGTAHRFARRRSVMLRELAEDNFLLLDLPMSRDYFLSLFRQAGVNPNITGRYGYIDVIRSLVGRGEGYSLANARPRNLSTLDGRKLSYLALEDSLRPLVYGIALFRGMRRTPTAEAFIELCRELLEGKPLPGTC
ncbi:LysR family transcriptional regulator [Acidocella sp.]|uniref:LysR family transcriptional regulator n=1 Tax=Acidocella sp. TaxID=50710 RepID=UPI00260533E8|nr:LysR family transcriptional regulator [Acidocella sp.]